jgi:hypothetical protein
MGLPINKKMRSFEGVGAGQTATCKLVRGNTYDDVVLAYAGVTLAQMTEVRLVINGEVERRWAGAVEIDSINKFEGRGAASGKLVIDFGRFHQRLRQGREATSIGTGLINPDAPSYMVNTMFLEIDISAAASNPVLSLKANLREPRVLGAILKRRITNESASGAAVLEVVDLHKKNEEITRIFFNSDKITALKIERDGKVVFERDQQENEQLQKDEGLNPDGLDNGTGNIFCYFPGERGYVGDTLVTQGVADLRFYLTMSGADDFSISVESIGAASMA